MSNLKGLELKNGKIVVKEKAKELRVRKNYSLPQDTIDDVKALAKILNCSESEAFVEAMKMVNALLVIEEEPKVKKETKKATKEKNEEAVK